jgi:multiple sugar transport system ATP-binding protein
MTVYDNLAFTLRMKKVNKKEIDSRVRQIAEMLEIDHLLSRKPSALSGGESQRVALGRALVRKRKVYLFDEPLSNLDAKLRSSMRAKLIRLHEELGATFVYVTHDQTEAMTMGDRIVVMNKGRIMQCDPPQKIYSHPENMFTAGFIGTPQINFIDGTIPPDDRPVKLAVRPESLLLNCESEDCIYLGSGKVELVELLGANMNVHIDLGKTSVVLITEADPGIARGEVFHVSVRPEDVLVFDSQTGLVMEARSYAAV